MTTAEGRFAGRVGIVTGPASRLGAAAARRVSFEDPTPALADIDEGAA